MGGITKDVSQFKRTSKYQAGDYQLLLKFAYKFEQIITTPNILTEVSNLVGSNNINNKMLANFFQKFTQSLTTLSEEYIKSQSIPEKIIHKYGLTDAGIIHFLVKDKYLLLTDDGPLRGFAESKDIDVINFNNIKYSK